jgi:hypothetical protein
MAMPTPSGFVVLDIDGVLADVRHRLHYLDQKPKNWEAFFSAANNDGLLEVGADFAITAAASHQIVYLTGRPERLRAETTRWLQSNGLPPGPLLMRMDGDRRPAVQTKLQQLRRLRAKIRVELVVDDDPIVIDAVAAAGFEARLADWMPRLQRTSATRNSLHGDVLREAQERDGRT